MVSAFIIIFYLLVIVPILCLKWKQNTKRENVFFIVCICISFICLFIRGLNIRIPDPTQYLLEWFNDKGLGK